MRRPVAILIAVAVLVGLAWAGYRYAPRQAPSGSEVTASGTLNAVAVVQVSALVLGEVKEVSVDFNTPVKRGQVLARLVPAASEQRSNQIPVDGTIVLRNVAPGQVVTAGPRAPSLFAIAPDLHEMQLEATVSAADARLLRVGMSASFAVEAFPRRTFSGEVLQIRKSAAKGQAATYTVVLAAANPELALLPGMTARVRIALETAR